MKSHITKEIERFNAAFYYLPGCLDLEPAKVELWTCGFCTDHEPVSKFDELVNHVVDDHCQRPTNPLIAEWSLSMVMHNYLSHGILQAEYRILSSLRNGGKSRFLWPTARQTLEVLTRLQTEDYNIDKAKYLVNESCAAATHVVFPYNHLANSDQGDPDQGGPDQGGPDQGDRPDSRPGGAAGGGQLFRGNIPPSNGGTGQGGDSFSRNAQPSQQHKGASYGTFGANYGVESFSSGPIDRAWLNRSLSDCAIKTRHAHPLDNVEDPAIPDSRAVRALSLDGGGVRGVAISPLLSSTNQEKPRGESPAPNPTCAFNGEPRGSAGEDSRPGPDIGPGQKRYACTTCLGVTLLIGPPQGRPQIARPPSLPPAGSHYTYVDGTPLRGSVSNQKP
jgi:hypothetical protein